MFTKAATSYRRKSIAQDGDGASGLPGLLLMMQKMSKLPQP